jgi:hypothetical protein
MVSVKKLADKEKWVAEPPNIFSRFPNGVSTASNATEPTANSDTSKPSPYLGLEIGLFIFMYEAFFIS